MIFRWFRRTLTFVEEEDEELEQEQKEQDEEQAKKNTTHDYTYKLIIHSPI